MSKQNEIKVFKPRSKQAHFTVRSVTPSQGVKKLAELLDKGAADKVEQAFNSLSNMGADSLNFHYNGRKIKVELAHAA